jgi:hypothetical protein
MSIVVVRPRALADLADIWAYIARQSADDSPDQADAFVDLVDRRVGPIYVEILSFTPTSINWGCATSHAF